MESHRKMNELVPVRPVSRMRLFTLLMALVLAVVGSFAMTEAAMANGQGAGQGHAEKVIACQGKVGIHINLYNDGAVGSPSVSFDVKDNIKGFLDHVDGVEAGELYTHRVDYRLAEGQSYNIAVTGPSGYSETFAGTFTCGSPPTTTVPPVTTTTPPPTATTTAPPVAGKGHAEFEPCGPKGGFNILLHNDGVAGAAPVAFDVRDNVSGTDKHFGSVIVGVPFESHYRVALGASYNITVTGPSGYSETFAGTFTCGSPTTTTTAPPTATTTKPPATTSSQPAPTTTTPQPAPSTTTKPSVTSTTVQPPAPVGVAPEAPSFNDEDNTFTVPPSKCFRYGLDNSNVFFDPNQPVAGEGEITIVAVVKDGCLLDEVAQTEFPHTFVDKPASTSTQPAPTSTTQAAPPVVNQQPGSPAVGVPPVVNPPAAQPPTVQAPVAQAPAPNVATGNDRGFVANTGWDEHIAPGSQGGNALGWAAGCLIAAFALGIGACTGFRQRGDRA